MSEINIRRDAADIAIDLTRYGFAVHPLRTRAKDPASPHGFYDATADETAIRQMFGPSMNVAIACGAVSGNLGVIDVDVAEDGTYDGGETLAEWQQEHGSLPETATVVTGRGGTHLYYRFPNGTPTRYENTVAHVDFRGSGSYVMAPGSIHPNGNEVFWDLDPDEQPIADANENVIAFVEHYRPKPTSSDSGETGAFELPDVLEEGARDNTIYRYACSERARNVPKDVALAACQAYNAAHCKPPLKEATVARKVASAYKKPAGSSADAPRGINAVLEAINSDELIRDSIGYDAFAQRRMVCGFLPWDQSGDVRPWQPEDEVQATAWLQQHCKAGRRDMADALVIHADRHRFDPLLNMLLNDPAHGGLPAWDGRERVGVMLVELLGAKDTPYARAAWQTVMAGAFMRAIRPGWKFDLMPVLYGEQGVLKSRFCELLAIRPEWYLDGPRNLADVANSAREMSGKLICEQSELATLNKADVETVKATITRTHDVYVDKWQTVPTDRPRRCIFIGTTNKRGFLRDQTGNRRFLPFEVGISEPSIGLYSDAAQEYIEQAWSELAHRYRAGGNRPFRTHLLPKLEVEAEAVRGRFSEVDATTEAVHAWLEESQHDCVCATQVAVEALGIERSIYSRDKRQQLAVTNALDRCPGWRRGDDKARIPGYGTRMCWVRV